MAYGLSYMESTMITPEQYALLAPLSPADRLKEVGKIIAQQSAEMIQCIEDIVSEVMKHEKH